MALLKPIEIDRSRDRAIWGWKSLRIERPLSRTFRKDIKNPTGKAPGRSHQPLRQLSGDSIPINQLEFNCYLRWPTRQAMRDATYGGIAKLSRLREAAYFAFPIERFRFAIAWILRACSKKIVRASTSRCPLPKRRTPGSLLGSREGALLQNYL